MPRTYNREANTIYHRERRARLRESFQASPAAQTFRDDTNDTVTRIHRGCGARVYSVHSEQQEHIRCEAGHVVREGAWDVVRIRAVESRILPAADVSDVMVEGVC